MRYAMTLVLAVAAACGEKAAAKETPSTDRLVPPSGATAQRDADPNGSACAFSFQVDRMPDVDPKNHVGPAYPEELRSASMEGSVRGRFVVDTNGYPDASSFHEISSSHRYFTAAVVKALPRMHYLPAMWEGRPVRCWTEQSFEFSLTH